MSRRLSLLLAAGACASSGPTPAGDADGSEIVAPPAVCPQHAPLVDTAVSFDSAGLSAIVEFVVPPNAQSVLLVLDAVDARVTTASLRAADGVALVADGWLDRSPGLDVCVECLDRVTIGRDRHAALVPNRPGLPLEAGPWSARFARVDEIATAGHLVVTAIVGDALVTRRTLPVTILLAGEADRSTAASLSDAIARLVTIYGNAGLTLEPTIVAAPTLARTLSAESVGAASPAGGVSVVLVDRLETADGITLLGIAPTPGAVPSGAVYVTRDAPDLGRAMAHELGHFLGLFHPTETSRPDIHDPIPDTPLTDSDNLMDVFADGTAITPQQRGIIEWHPALRLDCE